MERTKRSPGELTDCFLVLSGLFPTPSPLHLTDILNRSGPCIRGHRSSKCKHEDRVLIEVRKPGRPLTTCPHPAGSTCNCTNKQGILLPIGILSLTLSLTSIKLTPSYRRPCLWFDHCRVSRYQPRAETAPEKVHDYSHTHPSGEGVEQWPIH